MRISDWSSDVCSSDLAGEAPMNNKLKVLRAMRSWSQAELADRLDVTRQAVNAIQTGRYDPSLPLAFQLDRLFAMMIEEIFDDGFYGTGPDALYAHTRPRRSTGRAGCSHHSRTNALWSTLR